MSKGVDEMSGWIFQVQPTETNYDQFMYFCRVAAERDWPGFLLRCSLCRTILTNLS